MDIDFLFNILTNVFWAKKEQNNTSTGWESD